MEENKHIVNLDELARRLRLSKRWLRAEAVAGRIPFLKAGNKTLFNPEAVRQTLADRAAESEGSSQ